ncbi:MFS transporter [Cupriavidus necator]|uniref:MFS transporter n=1 Tax=Cupriavidus necator TaxID=106590 RepID=UPI0005B3080B|nr:MFS transporter [Cupriavidus necator]
MSDGVVREALTVSEEDSYSVYKKVTWRIIPLLFIGLIAAYLDRVNVGFAKLQMLDTLGFSEKVYGFGAGIFFIGYFLFEVPSNIILHRIGARRWIARIMLTWGILSACTMFVTTPISFYVLRFLLGVAEAGFLPGVVLYLTYWFPTERRGKVMAIFLASLPICNIIGFPTSGWIMQSFNGVLGFHAWQWLFLLEAIPSVLIGVLILMMLDDRISEAKWLTSSEKIELERALAAEASSKHGHSFRDALCSGKMWLLSLVYFCVVMGVYVVSFWLPTVIAQSGVRDPLAIGFLAAIPYVAGLIAMICVGAHSDRTRERRWHVTLPAIVGGVGIILSALFFDNTWLSVMAMTIATAGVLSVIPVFWTLPSTFLGGTAAAAGIAMINSVGNLSGFVGTFFVGWIKDVTQNTNLIMYSLSAFLFLGGLLILAFPKDVANK